MQDKSFLQAMHDLQESVSGHVQESLYRMILHRTTVANATSEIQNESMRTVVTNEIITDQLITLLALMKDLGVLDEAQYDEFTAYLRHALISQHMAAATGSASNGQ